MGRRQIRLRRYELGPELGPAALAPYLGQLVDVVDVDRRPYRVVLLQATADGLQLADRNPQPFGRQARQIALPWAQVMELTITPAEPTA